MSRRIFNKGSCDWLEIYQCTNPELNGEVAFAESVNRLFKIDRVIDVGAADSYLPKIFTDAKDILLFDKRQMNHKHENVTNIMQFVGTGENQGKLKDYHLDDYLHFYKIDTDGNDWDVIQTIDEDDFDDIPFLQFEYDYHWIDKGASLKYAINYLSDFYNKFYKINFSKLVPLTQINIHRLEKQEDPLYTNIVCTNHDFIEINKEMLIHHPDLDGSYYDKLKEIASRDLSKGNTEKRRGKNTPHWTFEDK